MAAPREVATSLSRGTNWWGAFVIGLAGIILVTGIVPFAVPSMGAAAIPAIVLVLVIGLIVCLCMGELAAMCRTAPEACPRTPMRASILWASTASHIGGVSGWSYWLGWFPVAPINMILAASYIAVLFHVPLGKLSPLGTLGTPEGIGVLIITLIGLMALFIPCYLGIRLGARFATVLGVVSMVPLTLLIILPMFKPCTFHWSNVSGFHYADPKTPGSSSSWPGSSLSPGTASAWRRPPATWPNAATQAGTPKSPSPPKDSTGCSSTSAPPSSSWPYWARRSRPLIR